MNTLIKISPNMLFLNHPSFGNFNSEIVFGLFKHVDIGFSKSLGLDPFSSTPCIISYNLSMDCPMCCKEGFFHYILLCCSDNYWCQWLFQFAHEYCHHLIDGDFSGELKGLMWFEESVCELSSMYHLHNLALDWECSGQELKTRFAPSVRDYLNRLLDNPLLEETCHPGFLHGWANLLQGDQYQRPHYRAIAARMLPLFVENPHLWKVILHFGDMRRWVSLEELFFHLENKLSPDHSGALLKLRDLLLS